jgi:hypothetical protein
MIVIKLKQYSKFYKNSKHMEVTSNLTFEKFQSINSYKLLMLKQIIIIEN